MSRIPDARIEELTRAIERKIRIRTAFEVNMLKDLQDAMSELLDLRKKCHAYEEAIEELRGLLEQYAPAPTPGQWYRVPVYHVVSALRGLITGYDVIFKLASALLSSTGGKRE